MDGSFGSDGTSASTTAIAGSRIRGVGTIDHLAHAVTERSADVPG